MGGQWLHDSMNKVPTSTGKPKCIRKPAEDALVYRNLGNVLFGILASKSRTYGLLRGHERFQILKRASPSSEGACTIDLLERRKEETTQTADPHTNIQSCECCPGTELVPIAAVASIPCECDSSQCVLLMECCSCSGCGCVSFC
jgi:hypothetical protein